LTLAHFKLLSADALWRISSLQTLAAILQAEPENSDLAQRTRFFKTK